MFRWNESFSQNSYRKKASNLGTYRSCQIWKCQSVSFKQAIEDLERTFEIVDNYITEKKCFFSF